MYHNGALRLWYNIRSYVKMQEDATMKKTKLLSGLMALILLVGCTPKPQEEEDHSDDLCWQAAGIKSDYALLTVNGADITAEEYLFWLSNAISVEQQYYGLSTDEQWEAQAESLKAQALETTKLYQVVRAKAAEVGATLSDEQKQEAAEQIEYAIQMYGGEEAYLSMLDSMCVSRALFEELNSVYFLNEALLAKLRETGEITVSETDRDTFVSDFMEENGIYGAKHILLSTRRTLEDGTFEEFSDEEKAAVLEKAQGFLTQIRAAEDPAATFDELMKAYSEDGRDASTGELYYPDGYTMAYAGQMVSEFENAALALEVGQISDVVTTSYGYHIIMRIPADEAQIRAYATDDVLAASKLDDMTRAWIEEAKVETTQAYDDLDPQAFWEQLEKVVEAREIAKALESSAPTESPSESPAQ